MRLFLAAIFLAACGDSGITPDPSTTTSSTGGSTGNGGAPNDGGNMPTGGAPQGGGVPGGGNESGTRLKVMTHVGSDGSRFPGGWFDSDLNTECQWRVASDGSRRCLPLALSTSYYIDASCSQPLAVQDPCTPLQFVSVSESQTCGTRFHVWPLGSQVSPGVAYTKSGANCVTAPSVPQGELYATGSELGASQFVGETIEIDP